MPSSHEPRPVTLKPDGFVPVSELVKFRMLRLLRVDAAELDRVMQAVNRGEKIRFDERRGAHNELIELSAGQGHSGAAHAQMVDEVHLTKLTKDQVPRYATHGTKKQFTGSIARTGLYPGGDRGRDYRAHVHLVKFVNDGETTGMRGGSDAFVKVDMHKLMDDGADVFVSSAGVYLTSGIWEGGNCLGILPRYFAGITDIATGESMHPLPVPSVDSAGRPEGAERVVAQAVISAEEANRLQSRVGFTLEDEAADNKAFEAKAEARKKRFAADAAEPCSEADRALSRPPARDQQAYGIML